VDFTERGRLRQLFFRTRIPYGAQVGPQIWGGDLHKTRRRPYDRIEVSEMPNRPGDRPEMLVDSILPLHPRLRQDLFQMDEQLWAIHGYIPVDGDVILAEFERRETAMAVLAQLAAAQEDLPNSRYGSV
jgi:hypothetical protein